MNDFFVSIAGQNEEERTFNSFVIAQRSNLVEFYCDFPITPFFYKIDSKNARILFASKVNFLNSNFFGNDLYNAEVFHFRNNNTFDVKNLNEGDVFIGNPFFTYLFDLNTQHLQRNLKKEFANLQTYESLEEAKKILKSTLIKIFSELKSKIKECVILFSGGLDSSLIALMLKEINPKLITLGVKGFKSDDIQKAKEVADFLNLKLEILEVELKDIENAIPEIIPIIGSFGTVKVEVGLVSYLIYKLKNIRNTIVLSGLGSEELFAGYERHLVNPELECWSGTFNMIHRDVYRDYSIAKYFNNNIVIPLFDKELIKVALGIKNYKIYENEKKYILRIVAEELGLGKFAFRKKKAAQYGSSISKALKKISKRNGFERKEEYLHKIATSCNS